MKTVILIIIVFSISFNYSNAQGRTQGTDKKTESRTDKNDVVKPVDHTPPVKIDNDIRTRPPEPPLRSSTNRIPVTSPVRPINPPTINNTSSRQPVLTEYVPIPIYDEPNDVVVYDYVSQEPPPPPPPEYYNYKEIGLSQFEDEDYFDALYSFQIALATDTQNYSLYYNIGITEIEIERYDDAIYSLTKFIDNLKDNKLGYYQRGLARFYSGDRDAALEDFLIADQNNVEGVKVILKRYYDYY